MVLCQFIELIKINKNSYTDIYTTVQKKKLCIRTCRVPKYSATVEKLIKICRMLLQDVIVGGVQKVYLKLGTHERTTAEPTVHEQFVLGARLINFLQT